MCYLSEDLRPLFCICSVVRSAQAGQFSIIVNFLSLSFSITAGVLEAYPLVNSVAKVTDVRIIKGWLSFSGFKAAEEQANLTACTLNFRPSCWMGALGHEASFFEYGERPLFYRHGRIMGEVLFLLQRRVVLPVPFFGLKPPGVNVGDT